MRELAAGASTAFIPQCGLAPGFVSIVGFDLAQRFDTLDSVKLRVGALPQYPSNALNYNLTWSTDGVINEYCEPCEAIVNGVRREVPPLEEREEFSLDGVTYEAFNTSGGLGTLCDTLEGKVRNLNYRTIRYPGHAAIMRALLNDLRLRDRRDVLKDILEHAVPTTLQDVVIIFVTVTGRKEWSTGSGNLCQQDLQPRRGRPDLERHSDHDGRCDLHRARSARDRPAAAERVHPPGGHSVEDVPGEPLRPSLRQAGDGRSASAFRRLRTMTNASLANATSVRDEALAILARLGVPESAFAREGAPASSPITGEVIAHVRITSPEEASAAIGRAAASLRCLAHGPGAAARGVRADSRGGIARRQG